MSSFIWSKTVLSARLHRIMIPCDVWNSQQKQQLQAACGGTRVYPNSHVASGHASLSPALCMLTLGRFWKTPQPPLGPFFWRIKAWKIHKLLNAESVPHWAWVTQLPHYTLSAPSPLFYSGLPPVQQYPSAGTSMWALWKKRESIWYKAFRGLFVEKILWDHEFNLKKKMLGPNQIYSCNKKT